MSEFNDLQTVIEDAVSDAYQPDDTSSDVSSDTGADLSADTSTETSADASAEPQDTSDSFSNSQVPSPAARASESPVAPVDPKLGIASHTNGRENRIPYSRVQKIVAKAEKEISAPLQAKLAELEPKVQQYEAELAPYKQFEQMMFNNQEQFLENLAKIPQYQPFFQQVAALVSFYEQHNGAGSQQVPTGSDAQGASDPMPGPTEDDGNGGKQYSMEDLQKLLDWQDRRTRRTALSEFQKQVDSTYGPIKQRYEQEQVIEALRPRVMKQMEEVRKWDFFTENEDAIVDYMAKNPNASVETAYRMVVFPKIRASREDLRQQILKEVQKAPVAATSAPARPVAPGTTAAPGTRSMEDVIRDATRAAGHTF